jgi:hypothetical protein
MNEIILIGDPVPPPTGVGDVPPAEPSQEEIQGCRPYSNLFLSVEGLVGNHAVKKI